MLNETLYRALARKFQAAGGVRTSNDGIQNAWQTYMEGGVRKRRLAVRGEQYKVCCPWCSDTRHRCYVSYEFGVLDPEGRPLTHLIRCHNEDCFGRVLSRRETFYNEVLFGKPIHKANLKQGVIRPPGMYIPPGTSISIGQLDSTHLAVEYLRDRGFDISTLVTVYRLGWCVSAPDDIRTAVSRIIIPNVTDGREVGWSARMPQDGNFVTERGYKIPKYYHMPGFLSQRHLYSFDTAKRFRTIILVEGQLDAIKVGAPATGLFGKSLSPCNLDRLLSVVIRTNALIVVALDPDKSEADKYAKHHIEVVTDKIRQHYPNVMPFYLPSGTDPAALTREEFKRLLYRAAAENDITLDFTQI